MEIPIFAKVVYQTDRVYGYTDYFDIRYNASADFAIDGSNYNPIIELKWQAIASAEANLNTYYRTKVHHFLGSLNSCHNFDRLQTERASTNSTMVMLGYFNSGINDEISNFDINDIKMYSKYLQSSRRKSFNLDVNKGANVKKQNVLVQPFGAVSNFLLDNFIAGWDNCFNFLFNKNLSDDLLKYFVYNDTSFLTFTQNFKEQINSIRKGSMTDNSLFVFTGLLMKFLMSLGDKIHLGKTKAEIPGYLRFQFPQMIYVLPLRFIYFDNIGISATLDQKNLIDNLNIDDFKSLNATDFEVKSNEILNSVFTKIVFQGPLDFSKKTKDTNIAM